MAHGGARKGAGRKPGALTTKTRELAEKAAEGGITPLDYMLSVLRDESLEAAARFEAAKAAAPYVHPRLSSVEASGPEGAPLIPAVAIEFVGKG
jgi:hypothetical protein